MVSCNADGNVMIVVIGSTLLRSRKKNIISCWSTDYCKKCGLVCDTGHTLDKKVVVAVGLSRMSRVSRMKSTSFIF